MRQILGGIAGLVLLTLLGAGLAAHILRPDSDPTPTALASGFTPLPTFPISVTPLPTATFTPSSTPSATATATATQTYTPTATFTPTITLTATPTPTATPPPPDTINNVPVEQIIVLPPDTVAHVRAIYERGQALGRNPRAFSRLGDSTIEPPHFFIRFDTGPYHLGDYGHLQAVIDYYAGSFGRQSVAIRRGLHTWSVFDPFWAVDPACAGGEGVLACEIRLHNPALIFIRLGSNDVGIPGETEANFRRMVQYAAEQGVIPVLGTKADRHEGAHDANNRAIRRVAADLHVPLWDFDRLAGTLPGRGLTVDGVHMTTYYAHDWRYPGGFNTGHGLHNLSGLVALDAIWRVISVTSDAQ